jgi:hypothetical protein
MHCRRASANSATGGGEAGIPVESVPGPEDSNMMERLMFIQVLRGAQPTVLPPDWPLA